MYISIITDNVPQVNLPSRGIVKRKIVKMMIVDKNKGGLSSKILDWLIMGFRDSEKVRGVSNELFPLVITTTI